MYKTSRVTCWVYMQYPRKSLPIDQYMYLLTFSLILTYLFNMLPYTNHYNHHKMVLAKLYSVWRNIYSWHPWSTRGHLIGQIETKSYTTRATYYNSRTSKTNYNHAWTNCLTNSKSDMSSLTPFAKPIAITRSGRLDNMSIRIIHIFTGGGVL